MATIVPPSGGGGGYDYQFVKTPSDMLICTICILPSKQPYLSECCGHTFCKSCLEGSKKSNNICPVCRSENFVTMFNKQADRVIRSLHVFCTNKDQGCEWDGEVNNIIGHFGNCLFQIVHCPSDCGESLQRQYQTIHVEIKCPRRRVSCQYCSDVGEYQFIEGQHKEECHKFPIQCPNKCDIESICRDGVEEHKEICPLEIVQCDYHVIGCKVKIARKDIDTHKQEMMEVHLSLSINELMETKMQLKSTQNNLKHEVENAKHEVEKTKDDLTQQLVWHTTKLANIEEHLTASHQEVEKTKEGFTQKMESHMVLVENHLSSTNKQLTVVEQSANNALSELETLKQQLSVSQQETNKTKEDLTQQLVQTEKNLTAKLTTSQQEAKQTNDQLLQKLAATEKELNTTKQQLATTCQNLTKAEKEHTTLAASTDKALAEMENRFQAKITAAENKITEVENKLQQKSQLIEETLGSWVKSLHYRASKLSLGNRIVPVVVKMTEFTKHKHTRWLSKPFYSNHNKEYKLQLQVNGHEGFWAGYMSVSLVVDPVQSQKPNDKYVVKLLNQITDCQHFYFDEFYQTTSDIWKSKNFFYCSSFLTGIRQYLNDDTLFFEVLKS